MTISVSEAVAVRRSTRAFLDRPVPRELIERVLDKARMAPSGYNFQPWEVLIVTGEPLAALSAAIKAAPAQAEAEYVLVPPGLPDEYALRRNGIIGNRMEAIGVARDDREGLARFQARNHDFFDAPVELFVLIPRVMGPPQWGDVGLWLQTVMLLLVEEGLASCPQESLYSHARLIKAQLGVDDATHLLWCGLAVGWPDPASPLNTYERPRAPLARQARFVGFD